MRPVKAPNRRPGFRKHVHAAWCWPAIINNCRRRFVAAGRAGGFGISLLERMMVRDGATVARCLDEQYRMHRDIMAFSSAEFYDDTLIAHAAVADHHCAI